MGRDSAKVKIYKPFGPPQTQAMSLNLLTAQEWALLTEAVNVTRVDFAPTGEEPRTQAVTLQWEYGDDDTCLVDWSVMPCPDEEAQAALAEASLQDELDVLLEKDSLAADEQTRADELERDLANLQVYRYWQEVLGSFGDGTRALYRACNAPNVPYKLRSNKRLDADRPFTVWFHRCRPHEGQQNSWVRLRFGHWALTIRQESQIELTRYKDGVYYTDSETEPGRGRGTWATVKGTDFDALEAVEAEIAAIQDDGRLTVAEKEQILAWNEEIDSRQAQVKNKKILGLAPDTVATLKAEIGEFRQNIRDLKDSRIGLTEGQQQQVETLRKGIILDTATVSFANQSDQLFNRDFAITFMPQKRGFLVLHDSTGRDYFVYEDGEVTDSEAEETIIGSTPLQIDGNGGALWFKVSCVKVPQAGWLQSGVRHAPRIAPAALTLAQDATEPTGTGVTPTVTKSGNSADTGFSWRVLFTSDGAYLPYLYRLYLDVPATARNATAETEVFDSSDEANADIHWEVGTEYSRDNRGRAITLTLTFAAATHADLLNYTNYQVQCAENDSSWFTGVLQEPSVELKGHTYVVTYRGYDRWTLVRTDRIWSESFGDGKTLGNYFRQMASGLGLLSSEIIISGARANMLLPRAAPGKAPLLQAEFASARADWLERLYDDFAWGMDMWFDGEGVLHLEPQGTVTKAVSFHLKRNGASDLRYMMDYVVTQDWSEFVNAMIVFGAEARGYKLCAQFVDWSSVLTSTSPGYAGRVIAADPYESSSLKTQAQVNAALRWRWQRYGRPYTEGEFLTGYDESLEVGDRLTVNSLPAEVVEVRSDQRRDGQMNMKVRFL